MKIKRREFSKSLCIIEDAMNAFMIERSIKREDIISIIPINNGFELWYWG